MNPSQNNGCATLAGLAIVVVPILLMCTAFLIVSQYTANLLVLIAGTILLSWLLMSAALMIIVCVCCAYGLIYED